MSSHGNQDRWGRIVNMAIIVTLAVLLLNPSGVVGRWITSTYRGWDEARRVSRNWTELVDAPSRIGESSSVIVEFVSYDCAVCRTVAPAVVEAVSREDVVVVVRHMPSTRSVGGAATEAAQAAICAERYGLFPEAHESLLADETWLNSRDWRRFAEGLGIDDTSSFSGCMGEERTQRRLDRDLALADVLQIVGTPTFASEEGLHLGASGLGAAVAAAVRPSEPEANRSLVPGPSTFDSSELSQLADALSFIGGGFFLPDSGIVLVERTEVYFVDMASGETRVFGREGGGPLEFRRIQRALRSPQGIALRDRYRLRVVFLDNSGEYVGDLRYNTVPFKGGVMDALPVAVHRDGRIVFRDREDKDFGSYQGRTWDAIEYLAVDSAGAVEVVFQAKGSEYYYEPKSSGSVFFGHSTLMAASSDRVAIAETDQEAIRVFAWDGGEVGRIPMPPAVRPSRDQVRAVREYRAGAPSRTLERLSRAPTEVPVMVQEQLADLRDFLDYENWPVNDLAPPIDQLFVDFDERLWVRDYHFTDQDSVTWRVWDMERFTPLFQVKLAVDEEMLDARGEVILLRREDELDVPRAVVSRLELASP